MVWHARHHLIVCRLSTHSIPSAVAATAATLTAAAVAAEASAIFAATLPPTIPTTITAAALTPISSLGQLD